MYKRECCNESSTTMRAHVDNKFGQEIIPVRHKALSEVRATHRACSDACALTADCRHLVISGEVISLELS